MNEKFAAIAEFRQRYKRGSIIVTSNLPFDQWTAVRA
jgi:hypothetical protein